MDQSSVHQFRLNTNAIIAVIGFSLTLITMVVTTTLTFARIEAQVKAWEDFQRRQETQNAETEAFKKQNIRDQIAGERVQVRLDNVERFQLDMTAHIDRVSARSEATQEDVRDKLNRLETQISIINQLLTDMREEIKPRSVHGRPSE